MRVVVKKINALGLEPISTSKIRMYPLESFDHYSIVRSISMWFPVISVELDYMAMQEFLSLE